MDGLVENGELDHCKSGPVVWVDCADSQPCIGTAGAITWDLKCQGHRFHSGLPHKGISNRVGEGSDDKVAAGVLHKVPALRFRERV